MKPTKQTLYPKFHRPDQDLLDSETKAYCQLITSNYKISKTK